MSAMHREMKLRKGSADFLENTVADPGPINVLRLCTWLSSALVCRKLHAIVVRGEDSEGGGKVERGWRRSYLFLLSLST